MFIEADALLGTVLDVLNLQVFDFLNLTHFVSPSLPGFSRELGRSGACRFCRLAGLREHTCGHHPGARANLAQRREDHLRLGQGSDSSCYDPRMSVLPAHERANFVR